MENNYYRILGIQPDANGEDIKRAYKRMALKFHPDKNKDPNAEEKFKKIAEAYGVLSDPRKRVIYDHGENGPKTSGSYNRQGRARHYTSHADPFSTFFGGSNFFYFFFDPSCQWDTSNNFADHGFCDTDNDMDTGLFYLFEPLWLQQRFSSWWGPTAPWKDFAQWH